MLCCHLIVSVDNYDGSLNIRLAIRFVEFANSDIIKHYDRVDQTSLVAKKLTKNDNKPHIITLFSIELM